MLRVRRARHRLPPELVGARRTTDVVNESGPKDRAGRHAYGTVRVPSVKLLIGQ